MLAGASPETLIAPVSPEALRGEIYANMTAMRNVLAGAEWANNRFYQAYTVLNFCRMLHDLHRGQAGSKLAGAEWMIRSGLAGEWAGLIERSWARRCNPANSVRLPADQEDYRQEPGVHAVRHEPESRVHEG